MRHPAEFRDRVVGIAARLFPDIVFTQDPEDPNIVVAGQMRLGLQNLRAKVELMKPSDGELQTMVEDHFGPVLGGEGLDLDEHTLEELRDTLRPQIMPAGYVEAAPLPIVAFPFAKGIGIGIVADLPRTYVYLRQADLVRWGVDADEVYRIALANLDEISKGMDIHLNQNGTETFLALDVGDGYDAARILLPELQDFFASQLGETFRFGIPNRDFLICWRMDCDPTFHDQLAGKVAEDHSERPYSLSPSVFVRNSEGNFHEAASA